MVDFKRFLGDCGVGKIWNWCRFCQLSSAIDVVLLLMILGVTREMVAKNFIHCLKFYPFCQSIRFGSLVLLLSACFPSFNRMRGQNFISRMI